MDICGNKLVCRAILTASESASSGIGTSVDNISLAMT